MANEKKRKTVWPGVLFSIAVLLVILVIASPFIIDSILKVSIVKAIENQLNTGASVSRVHLNMSAGSIEVNDLKIDNPPGYEYKHVMELKSIYVKVNVRSFFSDTVDVNEVSLDGATVVIEQKSLTNNLADILKSMPKKEKAKPEAEKPKQEGKNVHISSLDIRDINVKAKLLPMPGKLDTAELNISAIHLSNIGGKKTTLADAVGKIFNEIVNAIARQGSDILPRDVTGSIQENAGQVSEQIKKEAKDVTEKVKGLFKKKD